MNQLLESAAKPIDILVAFLLIEAGKAGHNKKCLGANSSFNE
jgi:hypothetical protein